MKAIILTGAICAFAGTAQAAPLGAAVSADAINDNFLTEIIAVDPGYDGNAMLGPSNGGVGPATWSPGDMFGITSRTLAAGTQFGIPFTMNDESAGTFTGDTLGIIKTGDNGRFFGVVDSVNGSEADGLGVARWTFDVSGASGMSVNIDMAAMGDFGEFRCEQRRCELRVLARRGCELLPALH